LTCSEQARKTISLFPTLPIANISSTSFVFQGSLIVRLLYIQNPCLALAIHIPHYFTNFPAKCFTRLFNVRRLLGVYFATSLKSNLCTKLTRQSTAQNKVTIVLRHKTQLHFNSFPHESTGKVKTNLSTSPE